MRRIINIFGLGLLALLPSLAQAQAERAARQHDGAAKVWIENGRLCLGAEPSYEVGGLFADAAKVAQHQVMLSAVLVHKDNHVVWQAHAPKIGALTARLKPQACLPYGKTPPSMEEIIPAEPLGEGLYTVMLVGSDEQNRRAWFYQHFCLGPNTARLSMKNATFDAASGQWQCL